MTGSLTVISGPMFSGKTEALIEVLRERHAAKIPLQMFVPALDTRHGQGCVCSHGGVNLASLGIAARVVDQDDPRGVFDYLDQAVRVVGFDEAQFFSQALVGVVKALLRRGVQVFVSGLDLDYREEPFGPLGPLLTLADTVIKRVAFCARCGRKAATRTFRTARDREQVLLGASEAYEALCPDDYYAAMVAQS